MYSVFGSGGSRYSVTPAASLTTLQRLAADRLREVVGRQAADQRFGELAVVQALEVAAQLVDEAEAHLVRHDLVVEDPLLAFGNGHGLGQQVVHLDHFDAAVAHLGDEVEVVALGVLDPQHVVEQQLVAVADGVRRWCARPGAQTITLRSWPTSEWTPNLTSFLRFAMIATP